MRILANSVITDADITATNFLSFAGTEKLQIYQLENKFKCTQGTTKITLDFGATETNIDYVSLCGTNISESASVSLSYSSSDPDTPEATISLPAWSNFNQIFMLDVALNKRYWVIDISDPDPQVSDGDTVGVQIGYLSIGKYQNMGSVEFPHSPQLNLVGTPSVSATYQEFGTDTLDFWSGSWNVIGLTRTGLDSLLSFIKQVRNTQHCVLVEYEDSYSLSIQRPRYGVITTTEYGYAAEDNPNYFTLSFSFEERF